MFSAGARRWRPWPCMFATTLRNINTVRRLADRYTPEIHTEEIQLVTRYVEIRGYNLRAGTCAEFGRMMTDTAVPMFRQGR